MLSLDVALPSDVWPKKHRSYFTWLYGKVPDVVIEVVSNREGGEDTNKLAIYAQIGVLYYAIYDPLRLLSRDRLRVFRLNDHSYEPMSEPIWFPEIGLGLRMQEGWYEDMDATWLRWVDSDGALIRSGKENAEFARQRADEENRQRADEEPPSVPMRSAQCADEERHCVVAERQREAESAKGRGQIAWPSSCGSMAFNRTANEVRTDRSDCRAVWQPGNEAIEQFSPATTYRTWLDKSMLDQKNKSAILDGIFAVE